MDGKDTILVVTGSSTTRGGSLRELKVDELTVNLTIFLEQMDRVLSKTPEHLGEFQFVEFEISAEITVKGTLAILGTGGEIGAQGGLKFVFRRAKPNSQT